MALTFPNLKIGRPVKFGIRGGKAMIEFKKMDASEARLAEIEIALKKLGTEMASPNIKEVKHHELTKLRNELKLEQATLRSAV